MSASSLVIRGVTTACWAVTSRPPAANRAVTSPAIGMLMIRISLLALSRRYGWDRLSQPVFEVDLPQSGAAFGHQRALAQRRAEVVRLGVGDDHARIVSAPEPQGDESVKPKLLR